MFIMKKKSIVLRLRKSKIANFDSIYGGATNPCDAPSDNPNYATDPTSRAVKGCSGSGRNDEPQDTDSQN